MIPRLYPADEREFDNNGLGRLSDALSATVYVELNGEYEATIQYPITGAHYDAIKIRSIIVLKVDPVSDPQPMRVYRITRPINGVVTIYLRHIAYDLAGIVVEPYTASTVDLALQGLAGNASTTCPFTFWTDKATAARFSLATPAAIFTIMGGVEGSILDVYGGEYEYDAYTVKLHNRRGSDNGVRIKYGKNMTALTQDLDASDLYTGVYPYWRAADESGDVLTLPEGIIYLSDAFDFTRILALDLSFEFFDQPTEDQLRTAAQAYISRNSLGTPSNSITVSFAQLEQSAEYKDLTQLERVLLGDTVHVRYDDLGVNATARVVAIEYNALLERYDAVTIGRVRSNVADTLAETRKQVQERPTQSMVDQISSKLSDALMGARGGAVRLLDDNGDGMPDTLYIADNPDPALAVRVWRWNYEGWAASSTGYNGPWVMGATLDAGILANAVTAAMLKAGRITSADGKTFYLDLDNGVLRMDASEIALNGANIGDFLRFEFDAEGKPVLSLGSSANRIVLKILNDRIAFCDADGNELAYWTNNAFDIVLLQRFRLGQMQMVTQPNGSISELGVDD